MDYEFEKQIESQSKQITRLELLADKNVSEHRCLEKTDARVEEQIITIFKTLTRIEADMRAVKEDVKTLLLKDGSKWEKAVMAVVVAIIGTAIGIIAAKIL